MAASTVQRHLSAGLPFVPGADEYRAPGAVGAPVLRELAKVVDGGTVDAVELADGAEQSAFLGWHVVGVAGAAQQDEFAAERTDPRKPLEAAEGLVGRDRPEPLGVELPVKGGVGEVDEPLSLGVPDVEFGGDLRERRRAGKRQAWAGRGC